MVRAVGAKRRSGHAEELLALGGFINVTTLTARSTNRLSPRMSIQLRDRFVGRSAHWRACPEIGKGGESRMFKSLIRREDGQTMAEYGVVLAVITLGIVVALGFLSGAISSALDAVTAVL
jgi:Flp pilus assembly pilin Flp